MSSPTYEQRMAHPRRCQAHRTNGDPCGAYAIAGGSVCRVHGGAAPQAKRKARQRIDEAADRMAKALLGIADSAESEAVKLAAVKDALDRAGLKPPTTVEVNPGELAPWQEVLTGINRISRDESRRRRGLEPELRALPPGEAREPVDAEEVPLPPDAGPHSASSWVQDAAAEAAAERNAPGRGLMTAEQAAIEMANERQRQTGTRRIKRVGSRRV